MTVTASCFWSEEVFFPPTRTFHMVPRKIKKSLSLSLELAAARQTEAAGGLSCCGEHFKGNSAAQTGLTLIWEYAEPSALTAPVSSRALLLRSPPLWGEKEKGSRADSARWEKDKGNKAKMKRYWHARVLNTERLNWRGTRGRRLGLSWTQRTSPSRLSTVRRRADTSAAAAMMKWKWNRFSFGMTPALKDPFMRRLMIWEEN